MILLLMLVQSRQGISSNDHAIHTPPSIPRNKSNKTSHSLVDASFCSTPFYTLDPGQNDIQRKAARARAAPRTLPRLAAAGEAALLLVAAGAVAELVLDAVPVDVWEAAAEADVEEAACPQMSWVGITVPEALQSWAAYLIVVSMSSLEHLCSKQQEMPLRNSLLAQMQAMSVVLQPEILLPVM